MPPSYPQLCNRMIPQISETCYFNVVLNGFLQSPATLSIFISQCRRYEKELRQNLETNPKTKDLIEQFDNLDGTPESFCPPKYLLSEIADSTSTDARFSGARFVIMKAIKTFARSYRTFRQNNVNIPSAIASHVLQTTKVPLHSVKVEGGSALYVVKAVLKSIYGQQFPKRVKILFEHELSKPIPETCSILIVIPRMAGDEWLFNDNDDKIDDWLIWNEAYEPSNILDFSTAFLNTIIKLNDDIDADRQIRKFWTFIQVYISKLIVRMSDLLQQWNNTSTRKRKREAAAQQFTVDNVIESVHLNKPINVLQDFRASDPKQFMKFALHIREDEEIKNLIHVYGRFLMSKKELVDKLMQRLRRGYGLNHTPFTVKSSIPGFELGHAVISYAPTHVPSGQSHTVAGILCDGEPHIVDSNSSIGVYKSDWRSADTIRLMNYNTRKIERCSKSNLCGLQYSCYVRVPPPRTGTGTAPRTKTATPDLSRPIAIPSEFPHPVQAQGGRKLPWYFGRTVGAQYGKNKRLLQGVIKGREDKRWAAFIEKAISHNIPSQLRSIIHPFNGTDAQVATLSALIKQI